MDDSRMFELTHALAAANSRQDVPAALGARPGVPTDRVRRTLLPVPTGGNAA
ncbi:hypothetical protein [Streptomyces flavofungini]|uniref:Uncharacterized protein n=1 Tax=Streptomyces flavofungini TaxID=68200 RepID=A0ABS0X8A4_9ACTN|nr:hypothetical protein [Streptomyces flavofungini]MBJ3809437.1 hypothetical protein [Streptomyces flavofungini]GHC78277.1 hypothetical protein GCM10010349_59520 [Streptomyces flavofungini]